MHGLFPVQGGFSACADLRSPDCILFLLERIWLTFLDIRFQGALVKSLRLMTPCCCAEGWVAPCHFQRYNGCSVQEWDAMFNPEAGNEVSSAYRRLVAWMKGQMLWLVKKCAQCTAVLIDKLAIMSDSLGIKPRM
jgi:hypothetical protein